VVPQQESLEVTAGWDDLARARGGSRKAWRALFEQHSPRLLRMTALMTGSTNAARDCVQETFVRILNSAVHPQAGSVDAYLSTIAYRLALKEILRLRRLSHSDTMEPVSPDPSPLDHAIADERQREVAQALRELTSQHREILILRLHGGHTYEEIAEITGLPLGTVKSRIFNAVKQARTLMKNRGKA
jgi:RNA polymerase sigma-70 factor (ECF subfamily)